MTLGQRYLLSRSAWLQFRYSKTPNNPHTFTRPPLPS